MVVAGECNVRISESRTSVSRSGSHRAPSMFSIDSGKGQIITPQPVTTDINGDATILITSATPGDVLITATVGGQPIVFGSPARVHFASINIYVPKVFTPNGDGKNDVLKPILVGISAFHYFSVYNRWGNLLFTTQDPNNGWDGNFRGQQAQTGVYAYVITYKNIYNESKILKGNLTLLR